VSWARFATSVFDVRLPFRKKGVSVQKEQTETYAFMDWVSVQKEQTETYAFMDWLTRLLSPPPPDPRDKLFVIPSSTTTDDRKSVTNAALQFVLIPELLSIIAEYAAAFVYRWPPTTGLSEKHLTIANSKAISCSDTSVRIVAAQSLDEGPHRWRILAELNSNAIRRPSIGIGISTEPVSASWHCHNRRNDFLVFSDICEKAVAWTYRGQDIRYSDSKLTRRFGQQTITVVEVDLPARTMTISFQDERSVICALPVRLSANVGTWRPCVILFGAVSATILPWPDD
jgi:hypothetical protein